MKENPYAAVAVNWRRGRQRMRWLDSITDFSGHEFQTSVDMNLLKLWEVVSR